jgi:H+-transporting ATPase
LLRDFRESNGHGSEHAKSMPSSVNNRAKAYFHPSSLNDRDSSDPRDRAHFSANGHTSVVTVVVIWCYSICVTIVIAIVYFLLNRVAWLDNLGRKNRSHSDTNLENIISHITKLAVEHERDDSGADRYHLVQKVTDLAADE